MKKIPTLFKRVFDPKTHKIIAITPDVTDTKCWMAFKLGTPTIIVDGTYEAIGKHFNGNPYGFDYDMLDPHGSHEIDDAFETMDDRTFETVREYLRTHYIEGIVFWYFGEPVCKIKRSDFGYLWGDDKAKKSGLNEIYGYTEV